MAIVKNEEFVCDGAIIGKNLVLTAASCVNINLNELQVISGTSILKFGGTQHKMIKKFEHEPNIDNRLVIELKSTKLNAAIIQVEPHFNFSLTVQEIKLPRIALQLDSKKLLNITSYGRTRFNEKFKDHLLHLMEISDIKDQDCFKTNYKPRQDQLCASTIDIDPGYCFPAYGCPVTSENNLIGITDGPEDVCANDWYNPFFIDVDYMRPWIDNIMNSIQKSISQPTDSTTQGPSRSTENFTHDPTHNSSLSPTTISYCKNVSSIFCNICDQTYKVVYMYLLPIFY